MKMGRSYLSGSGFHNRSMDLLDKMKNEKDENIQPNQGNFGKIIGTKKDNDAVKIGSFGAGEAKHISFIPEDNIAEVLKKISFKEKKCGRSYRVLFLFLTIYITKTLI